MLQITERETLALLKRMSAGGQAAARQFYRAYVWPVRRFLRRHVEWRIPENVDVVVGALQPA